MKLTKLDIQNFVKEMVDADVDDWRVVRSLCTRYVSKYGHAVDEMVDYSNEFGQARKNKFNSLILSNIALNHLDIYDTLLNTITEAREKRAAEEKAKKAVKKPTRRSKAGQAAHRQYMRDYMREHRAKARLEKLDAIKRGEFVPKRRLIDKLGIDDRRKDGVNPKTVKSNGEQDNGRTT